MFGIGLLLAARKKRSFSPEKSKRRRGLLRLSAYGIGVAAVLGGLSIHSARADAAKAGVSFGRELAPLVDKFDGDVNQIRINGQKLYMSLSYSGEYTTGQILDKYEDHCADNKSALGETWANLGRVGQEALREKEGATGTALFRTGVLRRQELEEGVVMCFVKGSQSKESITDAVGALVKTKDFGALGKLRYVYVTPAGEGGTRRRVLTVWTEDSFSLEKIMPSDGSEPMGQDPAGVPRMPGTKRMLSAELVGTPFSMHVYRANGTAQAAADWYDGQMYDRGWLVMSPEIKGGITKGFYKDGVVLNFSATTDDKGQTYVAVGVGANGPDEKAPTATF
jgi:hypothetical protein